MNCVYLNNLFSTLYFVMANCALIRFDPGQIRKLRGEQYGFVVFCAVLHVE